MNLIELTSETTTERESSKLMEATEPMDESAAAVTTSLKKRKAESDIAKETDEREEEETDKSEEERTRVNGSDPEWDVDSFDGVHYHSSEELNEFSDEEHDKLRRKFKRQIIESKGFHVDPELNTWSLYSKIKVVRNLDQDAVFGQTYREYFADMARLCLKIYNEKKGFNVEFVEVVRGYYKFGKRSKAYITFKAKEQPDGPDVEYQAKTSRTFLEAKYYPILCRPAPTPTPIAKPSNQNK